MKTKIAIALLGVLALAGCTTSKADPADTNSEKVIIYNGKSLHCVIDGIGNTRTMSCDWVRYHEENPF
jgi:hypothetical protein